MNTNSISNEYNIGALNTVARYAGLAIGDVLTILGSRISRQRARNSNVQCTIDTKHRRAIKTVAKYAGIDVKAVMQQLESSSKQPDFGAAYRDKAA